jgi:hypothetical protein
MFGIFWANQAYEYSCISIYKLRNRIAWVEPHQTSPWMLAFLITEAMAPTYGKLFESPQVRNRTFPDNGKCRGENKTSGLARTGVI